MAERPEKTKATREDNARRELGVMGEIVDALEGHSQDAQARILRTVAVFFDLDMTGWNEGHR